MENIEKNKNSKWYLIQVVPNHELIVKENLENRVFEDANTGIEKIFLPFTTKVFKNGVSKKKPMFPGYLFIRVCMSDDSWYVIRNTQYVTGIIGSSGQRTKPTPITDSEIDNILRQIAIEEGKLKDGTLNLITNPSFAIGDLVEIKNGNFKNQFGKVKEISIEKQIAIIEIEFFGRNTPVSIGLIDIVKK